MVIDMGCQKCDHEELWHYDNICEGERFCTCIKFEELAEIEKKITVVTIRYVPEAAQHLSTWKGNGWDYAKKYGKSQSEMVKLYMSLGKNIDEIQALLRCKRSSIRGRMSELRNNDFRV